MYGSNDGRLNFIKLNNEALVAVFGWKGHVGDNCDICFKVVEGANMSLWPYARQEGMTKIIRAYILTMETH